MKTEQKCQTFPLCPSLPLHLGLVGLNLHKLERRLELEMRKKDQESHSRIKVGDVDEGSRIPLLLLRNPLSTLDHSIQLLLWLEPLSLALNLVCPYMTSLYVF